MNGAYYGQKTFYPQLIDELFDTTPHYIAVDTETISLKDTTLVGIGIALSPHESMYFPLLPQPSIYIDKVARWLADPGIIKIWHNAIFDVDTLSKDGRFEGIIDAPVLDTMIMAQLAGYPRKLTELAYDCNTESWDMGQVLKEHKAKTTLELPEDVLAKKCALDVEATYAAYDHLKSLVDMDYVWNEMKLIPIMVRMQQRGLRVDNQMAKELDAQLEQEIKYYEDICRDECFNPASFKQVGYILAKRGNHQVIGRKEGKVVYRTGEEILSKIDDPLAAVVLNYRELAKQRGTYVKPYTMLDRVYTHFHFETDTRRLASKDKAMQNWPKDLRKLCVPDSGVFTSMDYCVAPETLVLKTDLTWVPISSLSIGEELIGVDEFPLGKGGERIGRCIGKGYRRKMRRSVVEHITHPTLDSYKITTDNGTSVICSGEHRWLLCEKSRKSLWVETKNLSVGDPIRFAVSPWETQSDYDSGWLAGFLDGEGWVTSSGDQMGFAQNEGASLDKAINILNNLKCKCVEYRLRNLKSIKICGLPDMLRLLGTIRPTRLLPKAHVLWEGREVNMKVPITRIVSIEPAGKIELVGIQTSTRTFIANGLVSHNSQQELRVLAYVSGDRNLRRAFDSGEDIHAATAAYMFGVSIDQVTKPMRSEGKTGNFATVYGSEDPKHVRIRKLWNSVYPEAALWIHDIQEFAWEHQKVPTVGGAWLYIKLEKGDGNTAASQKAAVGRKAVDYVCQGSAAEITKLAMIRCYEHDKNLPMVLQIHDELVFDSDVTDILPTLGLDRLVPFHTPIEMKLMERWG